MKALIEIKSKRWASLILLPFILLLMGLFYWFIFGEGAKSVETPPGLDFKIAAVLVIGVGAFLFVHFLKMTFNPFTIFLVDEEGFEMNTGVKTGLIRWEEVQQMSIQLIDTSTSIGVRKAKVIAVYLKDPKAFRNRFNVFLRGALALNKVVRGATLYIPYEYVAANFEAFKELVERKVGMLEIESKEQLSR